MHFIKEYVVVCRVADCAPDDTDCEGKRCDCGDEIVGTDDCCDDGCWDDDASNSETRNDQDSVHGVQVVQACGSEGAAAGGHHAGGDNHEPFVATAEDGQEPEDDTSACEDGETDWQTADTDTDWVVAVDVEGLGGPEEEDGEEVCARDECDDECQGEDSRVFLKAGGEHRVFCAIYFPKAEGDQEDRSDKEWDKSVSGFPGILFGLLDVVLESEGVRTYLVTSPEKTSNEENHASDREESSDEVNTSDDFLVSQAR